MKYILMVTVFVGSLFASDIYQFDNSAYLKDKRDYYLKQAQPHTKKINCVNTAKEVKQMKSCVETKRPRK
jgi:hypothetical protein